jgi:hypothetical protein
MKTSPIQSAGPRGEKRNGGDKLWGLELQPIVVKKRSDGKTGKTARS